MRDIALILLFCPMLAMSVRHVHLGVILWVWTALAGSAAYLFGAGATFPFNKAAAVVTFVALLTDRTKRKFFADGHFCLHTLFVIQGLVSFAFALTDFARTEFLVDKMVKIWLLCALMRIANRERLQLHALVIVFTLTLGLHGGLEGMKYVMSGGSHKMVPNSMIGDNNYLALAILMVLPFYIYLYRYSGNVLFRVILAGAGVASFLGLIGTSSRGGLLGLGVLAMMFVLESKKKAISLFAVFVVGLGLVFFAPAKWTERMDTISSANEDSSFMQRVTSWKMHTILALDRPFLGGGYSALEDGQVHRAYAPQFGILSFIDSPTPLGPLAAHSIYFSVLGDLGFIGLILFLAMLAATFVNCRHIHIATAGRPDLAWAADLGIATRRSMILFLVVGAALSASYFEILYIQMTLVSVLRRALEEASARRLAFRPSPATVKSAGLARLLPNA